MKSHHIRKALLLTTLMIYKGLSAFSQSTPVDTALEAKFVSAYKIFINKGQQTQADSILELVKTKFPASVIMRATLIDGVNSEKDLQKKELLFEQCVAAFPIKHFSGIYVIYDYLRAGFGVQNARAGNLQKAVGYANSLEYDFWSGEGITMISQALLAKGDTTDASALLLQGINRSRRFLNPKPNDNEAQFAAIGFPFMAGSYGEIMYLKKNYDTAIKYFAESERYAGSTPDAKFFLLYASAYKALNRLADCQRKLESAVVQGVNNPAITAMLKEVYAANNNGSIGEDAYFAGLDQRFQERLKKRVGEEMIDVPALPFKLKDMNGKQVTLADMKGKVVVLDFWATWCGPCKASFPAMKKAQAKYQQQSDVQFLFIDCWEKTDNYETTVKEFIEKNNYDFKVLFDPKPAKGKSVAEAYGVTAIPAKFVIDGNGRIRFKLAGFTGGEHAAVEELSVMIEMAKGGKPA
ncbi:TlpA disulfide reductase family protein [Chitinophaga sp. sic0106]|uniref:TlpA disulfide reductase family protein n=1 Tax=Chitinophaga sp. sic0106 TaxID=2854785 RepID=UPI001C491E7B|nr:TlpA disulfide reductase family protein [Chitinophaga sp. sic0106]MBV7533025.1 TlpA family protein disulfide reductase [Chitinophaga sp. sic0106]